MPDGLYGDWIAASNWGSINASIKKASESTLGILKPNNGGKLTNGSNI